MEFGVCQDTVAIENQASLHRRFTLARRCQKFP